MNLNDNPRAATCCVTNPAVIVDAGTPADLEATPAVTYVIKGVFYLYADTDGGIELDAFTLTSKYSALFLACIDAAGTITVLKSAEVLNADVTAENAVMHWPEPTADSCPFCGIVVTNDSAAVFTGGTTSLAAADITYDIYNLSTIPAVPIATLAT